MKEAGEKAFGPEIFGAALEEAIGKAD